MTFAHQPLPQIRRFTNRHSVYKTNGDSNILDGTYHESSPHNHFARDNLDLYIEYLPHFLSTRFEWFLPQTQVHYHFEWKLAAAMYEGWRDATSCEWWGAKNQRPHSFLALMAITSPDSTSKMRLIICTDPFKEDWLDLMPSQITHKYLLHIKQLCMLCYCTLISDGCHQIIVSSVVSKSHYCNACTKTRLC